MSKRTGSGGNEPTAKRQCRIDTVNQTAQLALYDNGAWEILKQFLTTSMSLSEMDDALVAYLGDRYSEDDWVEPRRLLFYGDDDNDESLRVLTALWKTYIPDPPTQTSMHRSPSKRDSHLSSSRVKRSHKSNKHKNIYLLDEAEEGDDDEEGHEEGMSVWLPKVMRMQGPSAKQRLAATFDDMASWFEQNSQSCKDRTYRAPESRMYLLDVQIGWTFKGESYYMGLLLKHFRRDQLELLASPHVDDIQLHLESGWDKPFLQATVVSFSMQFLHVGDHARVITGSLRGEVGKVISTDHTCGSVGLELTFDECPEEVHVRLRDIERVFQVGDSVRVIAGSYLGLEGYILQMTEDVFHVCQAATKEVVEVSKYYLDRRPLSHTLNSCLPVQHHFEPPPDSDSIEIGDFIEVLDGEHTGKRGVVDWLSKNDSKLWFQDIFTPADMESGLLSISVPKAMVQRTDLTQTIQYTKERGYDVKPGDTVSVARGLEYGAKGVVQSVDFPNAQLTLICDGDRSLINVQIGFVTKLQNVSLDSFKEEIGQEVFVIGGDRKGYRPHVHGLRV
ncbi:hypothetical protein EDD22DRAFT_962142 [Suillus occidentalis]|nr:hypothetical protein EDD22DRAFT_962142 [Suillus occidentalis]